MRTLARASAYHHKENVSAMNTAGSTPAISTSVSPTPASDVLERVLVLEMVRVTEAAAIAASKLIGRGDEKAADAAAVEAMRKAFDTLAIDGTVVIGEGERDEAPMLFIGEKVGGAIGTGPRSTSRSIRLKARRSPPRLAPMR